MTRKTVSLLAGLLAFPLAVFSQDGVADWYPVSTENKPFVRWWWLGSAVDREGLTYNLEQFAAKGIGGIRSMQDGEHYLRGTGKRGERHRLPLPRMDGDVPFRL